MSGQQAFGVLRLAGLECAVDAQALEQVVNWPAQLQPHPLQGGALLGLFSLRGMALPLVDLRPLLGEMGALQGEPPTMVAIVNYQERRLGIAIHGVSDVMKIERMELCHLGGRAAAVALFPELALLGGERMVYLLDLEALCNMPEVLTTRSRAVPQLERMHDQAHTLRHLLVFECDKQRYAVDANAITELVDNPQLLPSKFGTDFCLGVTERRGVQVPALSINRVLGLEQPPGNGAQNQLLVMTTREGYRLGLAYDRMVAIVRKRASDILPLPAYGLREPELFAGVVGTENGEQALLLAHEALLEQPKTLNFAKVYQPTPPGQATTLSRQGQLNQTCLVFQAAGQFVVPLDQVLEILDTPERYTRFTQRETHLLGSFNLRGEQIPLVCLSSLIAGEPQPETGATRVLLVKGGGHSFGLVVGSTDSIETFTHAPSEHPPGWESSQNTASSANGRVRSLVSVGKGDRVRWMTLINLRNVVEGLQVKQPRLEALNDRASAH